MDPWVGPAIIAALVSGLVSAAGWFVTSWQARRLEVTRRNEKVRDFQVALFAEIDSDFESMRVVDRDQLFERIRARYGDESGFSVVVPHMAENVIFSAIVPDIHILPGSVIGPVVDYARLRQIVEQFVDDLRIDRFVQLAPDRQLLMYGDYLEMLGRLQALAERARAHLGNSLNNLDAGQSSRWSAPASVEPGSASGRERDDLP